MRSCAPAPASRWPGEVGEVVVTTLNADYPLIRFATGDLSAVLPGRCPCGRTNLRIKGWLGRADQTTKVRGMFVHAGQIAEVVKRHPEIARARLVVERRDGQRPHDAACRGGGPRPKAWPSVLPQSCATSPSCAARWPWEQPGQLPNDGKVIEDLRSYK